MNEITIPALVPLASSGNLNSIVTGWANKEPNRIILSRPLGEGWQSVSASEFESEVRSVAKGLIAAGIKEGARLIMTIDPELAISPYSSSNYML